MASRLHISPALAGAPDLVALRPEKVLPQDEAALHALERLQVPALLLQADARLVDALQREQLGVLGRVQRLGVARGLLHLGHLSAKTPTEPFEGRSDSAPLPSLYVETISTSHMFNTVLSRNTNRRIN